jgi:hypothetical protein
LEKHNIRTPTQGSPARPVRYVFSATKYFWRRRVRTDRRRDEGVGAGGGQLGSSARARRSLAVANPARALGLPWGRGMMLRRTEVGRSRRSGTVWRWRSLGSPAAGKARFGGFLKKFPYPPSFEDRRLDPCVLPTPSLVGTRLSIGCLRQCAYGYRNGTLLIKAAP